MTKQIWYELANTKFGECYLTKYISFQRQVKKVVQIITLIISLAGILKWKQFENHVWIAFLLIAVLQVFLLIKTELIRSDKEIEELSSLKLMYSKYFNKLEKIGLIDNIVD